MCRRSIPLLGPNLHVHRASELKKDFSLIPSLPPLNILKTLFFSDPRAQQNRRPIPPNPARDH